MRNRAVSTMLGYVLALGIAAVLVSGLFTGMTGFVDDQRETAVRSELDVVGNRIASDLGVAGRLASGVETGYVGLTTNVPDRVAGVRYRVDIERLRPHRYRLVLYTDDPAVRVTVRVRTAVPVAEGTVRGGDLTVVYDDSQDRLEVANG